MTATRDCFVQACAGETWPGEDWLILETVAGPFEVLLCDEHYAQYERGELAALRSLSPRDAVELCMAFPVGRYSGRPA